MMLTLLMMKVLLSFILKLNSHPPCTFASPLQNHLTSYNCYGVKNMLKLLAFKWLLKELLLETSHANLVICLS